MTTEQTLKTWDGVELFYRGWLPAKPASQAVLLFHRGHEHSARWQHVVELLGLEDTAIFAWDARGHGKSPGERGSAENLMAIVKDVEAFVRHVSTRHAIPVENMIVMAHSVGAVTVAAWVHDFAPPIRGMILATPAFRVKLYLPLAIPLLRLKQKLFGPGYVKSYVKAKMLTHDGEQATAYQADEAIFRQIAVNILLDLFDTSTRLLADAGAITVPTLMLGAGSDWVVQLPAQKQFFERLSSPVKEMEIYPGAYHALFQETNRQEVVERARKFILERFSEPPRTTSLLAADKSGYTKEEFDRLSTGWNPLFAATKASMKTVGRLGRGVRLGWESGFDSGVTLDYVYENKPQGFSIIGRAIDRGYLESIGWRGIRQRRINLQKILAGVVEQLRAAGRPIHIVDIAAGAGRYVLETMDELKQVPITAVLRDYKPANIEAARDLAGKLRLSKRAMVIQGDAFDRSSLAGLTPRPTIAIVSGLYELFPANEPVLTSLRGLADAVAPGNYLIYTNQPWHPQMEFIARVLTNREGQPWIMRRRTQAEMDELVRTAGFEKVAMDIDQWGIFTVSLARRIQP
jgi:alpha-beta hydrolase superfamily lysophospholipase